MEKRKSKNVRKNKSYKRTILAFILIFAIAIILVILELTSVIKRKKQMDASSQSIVTTGNRVSPTKDLEEAKVINEGLSFSTFVDKEYTEDEILNLSASEMLRLREVQIDKKNATSLSIQKVLGSAGSENEATRLATNEYNNSIDQTVNSSKMVLETDTYYIVKVEWDYITERTSKRYSQHVLVFKNFYYNMDSDILNMDNINKVKDVLDLEFYVKNYSNVAKRPIQSFIKKNGETTEYVMYYFDLEYGEENVSDKIYLTSQTIEINSATGHIENISTKRITGGVAV